MVRIKNAADFKYHLYISSSKLEMLYQQIAASGREKKSIEWGFDWKAIKFTRKSESEDQPDADDKLKTVLQELEAAELVGTVAEPKEYVKGILPMRWGLFRDGVGRKKSRHWSILAGRQKASSLVLAAPQDTSSAMLVHPQLARGQLRLISLPICWTAWLCRLTAGEPTDRTKVRMILTPMRQLPWRRKT
jgi:hypothetical protein